MSDTSQIDGSPNGSGHDPATGKFVSRNQQWRARKRRIAEISVWLATEYDATTPAALELIKLAATHLRDAERLRGAVARQRATHMPPYVSLSAYSHGKGRAAISPEATRSA